MAGGMLAALGLLPSSGGAVPAELLPLRAGQHALLSTSGGRNPAAALAAYSSTCSPSWCLSHAPALSPVPPAPQLPWPQGRELVAGGWRHRRQLAAGHQARHVAGAVMGRRRRNGARRAAATTAISAAASCPPACLQLLLLLMLFMAALPLLLPPPPSPPLLLLNCCHAAASAESHSLLALPSRLPRSARPR